MEGWKMVAESEQMAHEQCKLELRKLEREVKRLQAG